MMGKCFQEQDDIGRALGIYNEIIAHKSENPLVETLRNQALQYRLMCFNGPQRNDHQVAFNEASAWLEANKNQLGTQIGQGILWEKTIAEEKLAEDRNLTAEQKEVLLRQALVDATVVARYMGPYREPANAMMRRLKATLAMAIRNRAISIPRSSVLAVWLIRSPNSAKPLIRQLMHRIASKRQTH